MQKVITELKGAGIDAKDIQTASFRVEPRYTRAAEGEASVIDGYSVTNEVQVLVRNLDKLGDILDRLADTLEQRKSADPASSYVAKLYAKGLDTILKKIGEEATETVIAAKGGDKAQLVYEMADLWFHSLVLLADQGLRPADVLNELARREGLSGIAEKAARGE